ncbi:cytochrome c oxidase accessory protein CcoG [Inmirania thermothiophila]|uniref:Cytochrome c oxidase accessory protein FixG n=1 Tax=Inmirania thermothiophila TaxID=1750597 RepID=A0A3N1YAP6_9GAMM|nr:cytochrome c oxidase accessory protein CcoG [Inmirania thermothiophila]ROR34457.1 cytochrome c oxidase accessory protein FixG [Inmirania thermothiophila]
MTEPARSTPPAPPGGGGIDHEGVADLYAEAVHWHVNTGDEVIHAKRMPGRFRRLKWLTSAVWLIFFLGPYLRWDGRQAVMFDIPRRQFHIFGATVLPQDFWLLTLTLLFFATLLAVVTNVAGRVWCGYFCFQTVWTDVFTWIEERIDGPPQARRRLEKAPWDARKIGLRLLKHTLWLAIGVLTGITFTLWFGDAPTLWRQYLTLSAHPVAWAAVGVFTFFTYLFAGRMREQVCFWLCPYARFQGIMYDRQTILPTYDFRRGEPRGRLRKGEALDGGARGDCIDCKQCVAVCPMGVDIREGQQEGCITCGLCIDACDAVMDKVGRPRGLIRYACLDEIEGRPVRPFWRRPPVWIYGTALAFALAGILYGLSSLGGIDLKVLHERQPLYVLLSDGRIQNKYTLKVLNKFPEPARLGVSVEGLPGLELAGIEGPVTAAPGRVSAFTVLVRAPRDAAPSGLSPIRFRLRRLGGGDTAERESIFAAP